VTTEAAAEHPSRPATDRWATLARRVPFTLTVVGLMLLLGLVTQTLWWALNDRPLLQAVAYGLPALQDGRWWTPVSGAFFALVPAQYLPVAGGALLLVGWSELRLGTRRVAVAAVTCHLVGVLGSALLLLPLSHTAWDWAMRTATVLDAGFSAGALGAVAAATVTLAPPWRGRVRILLALYGVIAFLYIGLLWDLEHLLAITTGLVLGPFLVGGRPALGRVRFTRHEWRILAFTLFLASAAVRVLLYFVPSDGPLGAATDDADAFGVLVGAAVSLLLANGLRRGSRRVWHLAGALTTLGLLSAIAVLVEVLAPDPTDPTQADQVLSAQPQLAVDILLWAVQLWVLVAGRAAFRARSGRRQRAELNAAQNDRETAVSLLKQCGGTTMSWMGTWEDNLWFVLRDPSRTVGSSTPVAPGGPAPAEPSDETARGAPGDDAAGGAQPLLDTHAVGYVAHQVHRGVAIALGDAVAGDAGERQRVLEAFVEDQEARGRQVCFFSVTDEVRQWGAAHGYRDVVVAEEALIDLPTLEFRGKRWQDVRTALNRAAKEGVSYREGRLADMPRGLATQVRAISELWVGDKGLPEMGFTLGGVDEALDRETVVGLAVDTDQTVHGVTSWLPVYAGAGRVRGWTLDVMRRLPDGFRPVTEFLIASACLSFKDQGAEVVSLSGAPLAHAGQSTAGSEPLDRLLGALGEALEPLYGFRSLESFKQKFQPRGEPVHLVFRDEAALPRIGLALTAAYLPGTSMRQLAAAGLRARQDA
jgi:phosphatidylglycerol lysyltransferase